MLHQTTASVPVSRVGACPVLMVTVATIGMASLRIGAAAWFGQPCSILSRLNFRSVRSEAVLYGEYFVHCLRSKG